MTFANPMWNARLAPVFRDLLQQMTFRGAPISDVREKESNETNSLLEFAGDAFQKHLVVDEATSPSFQFRKNGTHSFVHYAIKRF